MRIGAATAGMERRAFLSALSVLSLAPLMPPAAVQAISATTMTGKTKPDLGMFVVSEPTETKGLISADLVLSGGIVATAAFDSSWPLAQGGYYDVEAATRDGDTAFLQVAKLGRGENLGSLPTKWYGEKLFGVDGRYGAYGQPTDVKIKKSAENADILEVSFNTLTPGGAENLRKGVVRAVQAPGSSDVILLTASASAKRWKDAAVKADALKAASTFRVASSRKSELPAEASSDYRYGKTSGPSNMSSRNDGF